MLSAAPVMRDVERRLLPSTRALMIWDRRSIESLFIGKRIAVPRSFVKHIIHYDGKFPVASRTIDTISCTL